MYAVHRTISQFPPGSRCGNLRIDNMIFYPYSRFYAFVAYYKDNACKIQQQRLWCVKTILQACTLSALVISCTYTGYFVYCLASTTPLIGIAKHQRDSVSKSFLQNPKEIRHKFKINFSYLKKILKFKNFSKNISVFFL